MEARNQGWNVLLISRSAGDGLIQWDPDNLHISLEQPLTCDAIINLAGASIAGGRWTKRRKKLIIESRRQSAATIEKYLADGRLKTEVYIGASAIGIYGNRENETVDENTIIEPEEDWLAKTAQAWEEGHRRIEQLGIRTIIVRIGLVLSRQGGAMKEMIQTAPFGFLGYFGKGHQVWSWIHLEDVANIFLHAITHQEMKGVYLATAPFPVTNKRITSLISKAYKPNRLIVPVPGMVLSLMLGEMHYMLMDSCQGYPKRLIESGYQFSFLKIETAIEDLMGR